MIGNKIKEVFEMRNMRLSDFALKIGTARQNVYRIFERESLDTQMLMKISEILDHDFFQYCRPTVSQISKPEESISISNQEVEVLSSQLEAATKEIEFLRKIVVLREEEKGLVESKLKIQLELSDAIINNLREKEKRYKTLINELEQNQ